VTGDIGTANKGKKLELDLASLEQMRRVRVEAAEPFLKRRVMFEGVLLSDLLGRNPDLWIWSVASMKVA
jgi:hypothetical protein